jgi:hypothetical protein
MYTVKPLEFVLHEVGITQSIALRHYVIYILKVGKKIQIQDCIQ